MNLLGIELLKKFILDGANLLINRLE